MSPSHPRKKRLCQPCREIVPQIIKKVLDKSSHKIVAKVITDEAETQTDAVPIADDSSKMKCPVCFETDEFLVGFVCNTGHVTCRRCADGLHRVPSASTAVTCPMCRSTGFFLKQAAETTVTLVNEEPVIDSSDWTSSSDTDEMFDLSYSSPSSSEDDDEDRERRVNELAARFEERRLLYAFHVAENGREATRRIPEEIDRARDEEDASRRYPLDLVRAQQVAERRRATVARTARMRALARATHNLLYRNR